MLRMLEMWSRLSPSRHRRIAAIGAVLVMATSVIAGGATPVAAGSVGVDWEPRPAEYDAVPVTDVEITMDDGVTLVGEVMYPANKGTVERADEKFPVLLTHHPYFCDSAAERIAVYSDLWRFFAERGYIVADICARGSGRSGGTFDIWTPRNASDGVQLVNWAAHGVDGSNGIVGLFGCSYPGAMQQIIAAALPGDSPVKAMAPQCTGAEAYRVTFFSGGMPTQTYNWLLAGPGLMGPKAGAVALRIASDIKYGGEKAYDREYWETRTPGRDPEAIVRSGIPALMWTGYEDTVVMTGTMELFASLQKAYFGRDPRAPMRPGQPVTGRYQVVVGPWGHGEGDRNAVMLKWFDTWLKNKRTGMADTKTPIHIWSTGKEAWVNASTYPMVKRYTSYHLDTRGRLTTVRPSAPGVSQVRYDQPDQSGASAIYTSEPLRDGATLAGPVSASIWVSSTSTNAQIIAALYDVAPDGTAKRLTRGSFVASLRELDPNRSWVDDRGTRVRPYGTFDRDQYLTPGDPVRLDIALDPRMAEIAPHHSLRVVLTTQAPTADCAAALGTDPCFPTLPQEETLPGTYTVHRGGDMPSAIHLPLAPLGAYPTAGSGALPDIW